MLKTISRVLPGLFESCLDPSALTIGLLGAPVRFLLGFYGL